MRPTVQRVFGAVMAERPVGLNPMRFISRRPGADDKVGVAGGQGVKHRVVDGADGPTQCALGRPAASEEAAGVDEF